MKTRNEIITESVNALRACFNYYSDIPLPVLVASAVDSCLRRTLPHNIPTEQWQKIADQYAILIQEEEDEESPT